MSDDLDGRHTQWGGPKTLAVLIRHIADDIFVESDDVDFLRDLLSRYFDSTPAPSNPPNGLQPISGPTPPF